jgi:hypothetical protein
MVSHRQGLEEDSVIPRASCLNVPGGTSPKYNMKERYG